MTGSQNAIGLIETRGIVSLVAGIEAMMKTAEVETINVERIGSGYFSAAVKGSIAAVRQSLDSGAAAVKQYGELRSVQLYPRPDAVSVGLLDNGTRELLTGGTKADVS
ncbi:BMC domain-containing protein [Streptosporangium sp. NPDC002544]|uniref:BMC domain-containing protein n=1 Tax=unclassified Streptosporangium TaxID=2632669 RepID=UPI00331CF8B5